MPDGRLGEPAAGQSTMTVMKHPAHGDLQRKSDVTSARRSPRSLALSALLAIGAAALLGWIAVQLYVAVVTAD